MELVKTIDGLNRVINPKRVQEFQELLKNEEKNVVIEKVLTSYYDQKYSFQKTSTNLNCLQTAEEIISCQNLERSC